MQDRSRTQDLAVAQEAERVRRERQRTMQHAAVRASLAQESRPAASQTPNQTPSKSWQRIPSQVGRAQEGFQEASRALLKNGAYPTEESPIAAEEREKIVKVVGEPVSYANKPDPAYLGLGNTSRSDAPSGKHGRVPPNQNEKSSTGQSLNAALGMRSSTTAPLDKLPQTGSTSQEKKSATQAARKQAKQAAQHGKESPSPSIEK